MNEKVTQPAPSPVAAHDTPAAQLREELAKAQRERDEARADVEAFRFVEADNAAYVMQMRAEIDSLRSELAALHPLADGYAGCLAELTSLRSNVQALRDEAEAHRVDYNGRADISEGHIYSTAHGYWSGRRDEAGHFRDKLAEMVEEEK